MIDRNTREAITAWLLASLQTVPELGRGSELDRVVCQQIARVPPSAIGWTTAAAVSCEGFWPFDFDGNDPLRYLASVDPPDNYVGFADLVTDRRPPG